MIWDMAYELMLVAKTEDAEALLQRVEKVIKETGDSSLKVDKLGKKRLAYPIKKQTDADYFVLNFNAQPDSIGKITSKLRLEQDDLLRYLFLKTKIRKVKKAKAKKIEEEVAREEKPKVTVITKVAAKTKKTKAASPKKKVSPKAVKVKGKKIR